MTYILRLLYKLCLYEAYILFITALQIIAVSCKDQEKKEKEKEMTNVVEYSTALITPLGSLVTNTADILVFNVDEPIGR